MLQTLRRINDVILSTTQLAVCLILMLISIPLVATLRLLDGLARWLLPDVDLGD